jgi:hypothetical protein
MRSIATLRLATNVRWDRRGLGCGEGRDFCQNHRVQIGLKLTEYLRFCWPSLSDGLYDT